MLRYLFAFSICFLSPATAKCAEIKVQDVGDGIHLITIVGEIKAGDENRFRALTLRHNKAVVGLASDGGALSPALEIGRLIHLRGYFTAVFNGYTCSSACALIWAAGAKRFLHPGAKLGFHASYYEDGGRKIEGGIGNALVGRYLTQLGMSERAIVFATMASPESITWLSRRNATSAGISFEDLTDVGNVAPPPVITPNSQASSGWIQVAEASNVKYFMDPNRLGRAGNFRTGWDKADHSKNSKVSYYEEMQLWYFDCAGRRMALKSYIEYGRMGEVSDRGDIPLSRMNWFSVVPDSIGESKLDFACSR